MWWGVYEGKKAAYTELWVIPKPLGREEKSNIYVTLDLIERRDREMCDPCIVPVDKVS